MSFGDFIVTADVVAVEMPKKSNGDCDFFDGGGTDHNDKIVEQAFLQNSFLNPANFDNRNNFTTDGIFNRNNENIGN